MSSHLLKPLGSRHRLTWPAFPPHIQQSIIPHTPHMNTSPRTLELSFGEGELGSVRGWDKVLCWPAGLSLNPGFGFKLCLRGFAYQTLLHHSLPVCLFPNCLSARPEKNEHQLPGLCKRQKDKWLCFLPRAQCTTHSILAQCLPFPTYSFFTEVEATKWGKCLNVYWVATTFIQTLAHPFVPSLRWRLPSQKKVYFSGLSSIYLYL